MSASSQSIQASLGKARDVVKMVKGRETSDGAGVRLRRYIASSELDMLDPFLLLDVFCSENPDDYIAGFPPHPHRGFETVTYLLHGKMRHKDSAGHEGVIESGGVQWMTAGRGIEHSEMPEQEKGLLYGFQLWVNLPAKDKMMQPRYQEIEPQDIPVEQREQGVSVRVVAGETSMGTQGAVKDIAAAPMYFDVTVAEGKRYLEKVAVGHQVFIYVIEGDVQINGDERPVEVPAESLVVFNDGGHIALTANENSRLLLVAGKPFKEPVARYGPFVMNTQEEVQQAFADYQSGQFGQVED